MEKIQNTKKGHFTKLANLVGLLVILIFTMAIFAAMMQAVPNPPDTFTNISTTTKTNADGVNRSDERGTITVLQMAVSQQTDNWKAYVGNITGTITLDDSSGETIYDWSTGATLTGEVFATRTSGTITWASVTCANDTEVEAEQTALQHTATSVDALNNTFTNLTHPEFWAGAANFSASACLKVANLYVDGATDSDTWHEILLHDGTNLVYAAIINSSADGYGLNHNSTDFQMIVAANGSASESITPETYFFYVEID